MCTKVVQHFTDHLYLSNFNGHFPGGRGLAGTGMSPFWILLEEGQRWW